AVWAGCVVSGGGAGGESPKESEAAGAPHAGGGRGVDEGIEVCRLLWSKARASFDGRFLRFADVSLSPRPAQPGGPPIWIGGRSDRALRRAGRGGGGRVSHLGKPGRHPGRPQKIPGLPAQGGGTLPRGRGVRSAHLPRPATAAP